MMYPIQPVAPLSFQASDDPRGPLVTLRDDDGRQVFKHWNEMTPQEREQWARRNRNFIRF